MSYLNVPPPYQVVTLAGDYEEQHCQGAVPQALKLLEVHVVQAQARHGGALRERHECQQGDAKHHHLGSAHQRVMYSCRFGRR